MPTEAIFAQVLPLTPTRGLLANREWVADASIAWRVTDETRAPILDPYTRKIKTGYFWALASDDRPWGGTAPPGVAFTYGPERGGLHAKRIMKGFGGILQVPFHALPAKHCRATDSYAGYDRVIAPDRVGPGIQVAA